MQAFIVFSIKRFLFEDKYLIKMSFMDHTLVKEVFKTTMYQKSEKKSLGDPLMYAFILIYAIVPLSDLYHV